METRGVIEPTTEMASIQAITLPTPPSLDLRRSSLATAWVPVGSTLTDLSHLAVYATASPTIRPGALSLARATPTQGGPSRKASSPLGQQKRELARPGVGACRSAYQIDIWMGRRRGERRVVKDLVDDTSSPPARDLRRFGDL